MTTPSRLLAILAVVTVTSACGPAEVTPPSGNVSGSIVVPATAADLGPAFAVALKCDVNSITWSVQEDATGLAGTVSATGIYTAPACGSQYVGTTVHIVGTGCGNTGNAAVAISENVIAVTVPYAISGAGTSGACLQTPPFVAIAGKTLQFYSNVQFTCHSGYNPALPSPLPAACP